MCASCSVASDSLRAHGLQPTRLLCPWILQARILEWVAMPASRASSQGSNPCPLGLPALAGGFFTTSTNWEAPFYAASPANGLPTPQPPDLTRASLIFSYSCWKLRNHLVILTPLFFTPAYVHTAFSFFPTLPRITSLFHAQDGVYSPPSSGDPPPTPGQTRPPFMRYWLLTLHCIDY